MTTKSVKIGDFELMKLESFPAGENPFLHDIFNMGTSIAKNVMIMHRTHDTEKADYFIIVNTETGERLKVVINTKNDEKCDEKCNGDDELRKRITEKWNGSYAFLVCRNCENYLMAPKGNIDKAVILDDCSGCCESSQRWIEELKKWEKNNSHKGWFGNE